MTEMAIQHYLATLQARVNRLLEIHLAPPAVSPTLEAAMKYAVMNGGKRIRPALAYAGAEAVGGRWQDADLCACALELVHAYSLVHDDLPAMDDDEERRGQPTCHVKFDEATAILAGDALQSLAFELLSDMAGDTHSAGTAGEGTAGDTHIGMAVPPHVRLRMIALLSEAIGWRGMAGGQSLDAAAGGCIRSEEELELAHTLKTGSLIKASVLLGALSSGQCSVKEMSMLETFGHCLGLAFQVKDDILDFEEDAALPARSGPSPARDNSQSRQPSTRFDGRPSYPALLGLAGARKKLDLLCEQGIAALDGFSDAAKPLISLARFIVHRNH